jgi:hypothetical protein
MNLPVTVWTFGKSAMKYSWVAAPMIPV